MITPALGYTIGRNTATLYLLDPLGVTPVEPVMVDLVPGVTTLRATLDALENDQLSSAYEVTQNATTAADLTTNVRRALRTATVTGTITAHPATPTPPLSRPPSVPTLGTPPTPPLRVDVFRVEQLQRLADKRQLLMLVTPNYVLTPCVITQLSRAWTPEIGLALQVAITVQEVRLVSPAFGAVSSVDGAELKSGSTSTVDGGQQAPTQTQLDATHSSTPGNAPTMGGGTR